MSTTDKVALFFFLVLIVSIPLYTINHLVVYEQQNYKIDVIRSHLKLALDTHNIDAKVTYIDDTVKSLEGWSGNGNWWFPNETTDIDKTRELLHSISQDVREQEDVKDKEGYFVLPHNELIIYLNSEIDEGNKRLYHYGEAIQYNPNNNILHWVLIPLGVFSGLVCVIYVATRDDW